MYIFHRGQGGQGASQEIKECWEATWALLEGVKAFLLPEAGKREGLRVQAVKFLEHVVRNLVTIMIRKQARTIRTDVIYFFSTSAISP